MEEKPKEDLGQVSIRETNESEPFEDALHRIWVDGTEFRWTREAAAA